MVTEDRTVVSYASFSVVVGSAVVPDFPTTLQGYCTWRLNTKTARQYEKYYNLSFFCLSLTVITMRMMISSMIVAPANATTIAVVSQVQV